MSFETAKPVTPESLNQGFQFTRRPTVRYPAKEETKQTVNISRDTLIRSALRRQHSPFTPKLSYGSSGLLARNVAIGQFFNASA